MAGSACMRVLAISIRDNDIVHNPGAKPQCGSLKRKDGARNGMKRWKKKKKNSICSTIEKYYWYKKIYRWEVYDCFAKIIVFALTISEKTFLIVIYDQFAVIRLYQSRQKIIVTIGSRYFVKKKKKSMLNVNAKMTDESIGKRYYTSW